MSEHVAPITDEELADLIECADEKRHASGVMLVPVDDFDALIARLKRSEELLEKLLKARTSAGRDGGEVFIRVAKDTRAHLASLRGGRDQEQADAES